jgi:TolB-like protein
MSRRSRWRLPPSLVLVALLSARPLWPQAQPVVVAVLPFGDRGSFGEDKEKFRALQLGIPATIAAELAGHSGLRLVDASRASRALPSQEVSARMHLDAATAARIGKEAGARYAITGSYSDFYGKIRLDARIIDTDTGQILKVVSSDPRQNDRAQLYRIIQTVGHKVLAAASSSRSAGMTAPHEERNIPTGALMEFSLGLLAEREGDRGRAGQHFQQAIDSFPDYPDAKDALTRVRGS